MFRLALSQPSPTRLRKAALEEPTRSYSSHRVARRFSPSYAITAEWATSWKPSPTVLRVGLSLSQAHPRRQAR